MRARETAMVGIESGGGGNAGVEKKLVVAKREVTAWPAGRGPANRWAQVLTAFGRFVDQPPQVIASGRMCLCYSVHIRLLQVDSVDIIAHERCSGNAILPSIWTAARRSNGRKPPNHLRLGMLAADVRGTTSRVPIFINHPRLARGSISYRSMQSWPRCSAP